MNIEFNQDGFCLKPNQLVKVRGGVGHSIVCDSGSVWVTQDGDPRDIVLRAGESFTIDRNGSALVQAFEQGAIRITRSAMPNRTSVTARWSQLVMAGEGLRRGALGI